MRIFKFLSALAPLCSFSTSAAVAAAGKGVQILAPDGNHLAPRAPKLERPPPGHMQRKRDAQQMFTFGGYSSNLSGDGKFLKLEEPIEANGHPHPWCQGFEGSNGYTEGQEPTIHVAHMDKAKNESDVPDVPQYICWFYNDFDCDPTKGQIGSKKIKLTHTHLTDLSKKNPKGDDSEDNRNIPIANVDGEGNRYMWIKSYGCMMYVDNPSFNGDSGSQISQAGTAQGDLSAEVPAEALPAPTDIM